jgi:hypothetical protein
VITRDIAGYVGRDWGAARAAKDRYWSERIERLGAFEGLRIAEELRQQAILQVAGWPSAKDRDDDFAAHLLLAERLSRADRARRR